MNPSEKKERLGKEKAERPGASSPTQVLACAAPGPRSPGPAAADQVPGPLLLLAGADQAPGPSPSPAGAYQSSRSPQVLSRPLRKQIKIPGRPRSSPFSSCSKPNSQVGLGSSPVSDSNKSSFLVDQVPSNSRSQQILLADRVFRADRDH